MWKVDSSQLATLWKELGISTGMVVMCHSFLASLGRVVPGPEVVLDTLLEQLGRAGTFVVPTFSYSYFRNKVYDVENSPSTVGVLGDLVRTRRSAIRSLDPNFSMAAIGEKAEFLMTRESHHSVGRGSIYDKLMKADVQILLLGVDYSSLALFMHLEKVHGVSYRYDKEFTGITRFSGRTFSDDAVHFVRDLELNPVSYRNRVGALIDQEPDCVRRPFAYGLHRFVPASTIARVVAENLAKDPFCLIKEPLSYCR